MKDWGTIKRRYLRDAVPVRLGGLAANLSRIKSFADKEASREAVASLIEESKYFIEWTARDAQVETAAQLVELQGNWLAGSGSSPISGSIPPNDGRLRSSHRLGRIEC